MIENATPEQWAEVDRIRDWWVDVQTVQSPDADVKQAVNDMWARMGHKPRDIVIVDSPLAALSGGGDRLKAKLGNVPRYLSVWWSAWAGWYEGAKVLGVEFDEEKYDLFRRWCLACPLVVPTEELCVVSRKPHTIHWLDQRLHCDDGMAVIWGDGTGLWSINGFPVDEQIVMCPESQTIEQIVKEGNVEVRRIRIERYGWERFLRDSNAKTLDSRTNDTDGGTEEALVEIQDGSRHLLATCKTGRAFAMEVDNGISTCEAAQKYLSGDGAAHMPLPDINPIGRS